MKQIELGNGCTLSVYIENNVVCSILRFPNKPEKKINVDVIIKNPKPVLCYSGKEPATQQEWEQRLQRGDGVFVVSDVTKNKIVIAIEEEKRSVKEKELNIIVTTTKSGMITKSEYPKIDKILDKGYSVLLVGSSGTGKTAFMDYRAEERGDVEKLHIPCDAGDGGLRELIGSIQIKPCNGSVESKFVYGKLTETLQRESVIMFDEINSLENLFFLHELINKREFFVKETGETIKVHPKCDILLACNPAGGGYVGTKSINIALLNRVVVVKMSNFIRSEIKQIIPRITESELRLYEEVNKIIESEKLDIVFSIRELLQYSSLKDVLGISEAISVAFLNKARFSLSDEEMVSLEGICKLM